MSSLPYDICQTRQASRLLPGAPAYSGQLPAGLGFEAVRKGKEGRASRIRGCAAFFPIHYSATSVINSSYFSSDRIRRAVTYRLA
ncbi:hypothetical protein GCM10027018_16500 [Paenibacillus thermoaerophilus]